VLDSCFKNPFTVRRLRGGPAGPFLDGFVEALLAQGYTPETSGSYLYAADVRSPCCSDTPAPRPPTSTCRPIQPRSSRRLQR
jgi:hypothetical protein